MIKLYLAHPLDSRHKMKKWEAKIEKQMPFLNIINPFYEVNPEQIRMFDANEIHRDGIDIAVVQSDIDVIMECDGIIALIDGNISAGTPMEIVYAHLGGKDVIILVTDERMKGHPWLKHHATEFCTTFEELEVILQEYEGM